MVFFERFSLAVSLGSQRSVAGRTCEEILSKEVSSVDGFYWLNSNGTEDPYFTFCNMRNGGGINTHIIVHKRIVVSKETGGLCRRDSELFFWRQINRRSAFVKLTFRAPTLDHSKEARNVFVYCF